MRAGGTGQDGRIALIHSDIWIGFPRAERVLDRLQSLIDAPRQTRMPGLLVHGASGIGKTMIARNLSRRYAPEYDPAAGITHTPLLLLQAPPAPDERRFYLHILAAVGAPATTLGAFLRKETPRGFGGVTPSYQPGDGSIIVVVATDAPLLPHQLKRIAARVPIGVGKMGGRGENGSGDIFIAFSTANPSAFQREAFTKLDELPNDLINPLFNATVQAVEEAITNAMVAAETMEGINGNKAYPLPHNLVIDILKKYNRIKK